MQIRARLLAPLAILGAVPALLVGGSAVAGGKPAGGVIHVYEVDSSLTSNRGDIILTGAINDHGKDRQGVAAKGTINKLVLTKGTFEVDTSKLTVNPPLDPKTCTIAGSSTGPVSIVAGSGTGAYRGLRGTVTTTVTIVGVLPKLKNGKCNGNAAPVAGFSWIKASGKVSFQ
ncbi:MAG TPA: hypothetical protein VHW04_00945 [Solirubrobacteraceae bacterium]|nr:hypothetical protein [Solirubrobacteraceae bacterium]